MKGGIGGMIYEVGGIGGMMYEVGEINPLWTEFFFSSFFGT